MSFGTGAKSPAARCVWRDYHLAAAALFILDKLDNIGRSP
jgi:hypothetical protein